MFGIPAKDIITYGVPAAITTFLAYKEWKERSRRKRFELDPNPERCNEHKERLKSLEGDVSEIKGDIKAIKVKIGLPID
jgi:hypothetical protein